MRIRQIKPGFWIDEKMVDLPLDLRLLYVGLWMETDDSGWLRWEPRQIVLDLLPRMPEVEALAVLRKTEKALIRRGRLVKHKCGHAVIPTLVEHQHFAGPTKQVHTVIREHQQRCMPQEDRGTPAGHPRPSRPVREGKDRLHAQARTRSGTRRRSMCGGPRMRST